MLFCLAMASIKYAVLKQIQHIFCTPHRRDVRWWIIQINISVNFAFYFALIICLAAACIPREAIWNPLVPGTCLNYTALLIASPVVNLLSDMGMLIVPFMGIKRLGWSLKKKIAAGAVFSAGFLCVGPFVLQISLFQNVHTADSSTVPLPTVQFVLHIPFGNRSRTTSPTR